MSTVNAGILGHVDAGKTTLTRLLADVSSTAAFDKHAEKHGRHNTIDLGFSCMLIGERRIALIDCPGHASLIRAVLSTCAVFDMAIVLIDASAGIQQQTAEHLLLASFFCPNRLVLIVNKVDLVERKELEDLTKKLKKSLLTLGISADSPIIPISLIESNVGLAEIKEAIRGLVFDPVRKTQDPFLMIIDHCFSVTGQGNVITGTIVQGVIRQNDEIEIAASNEKRRVRNVQSWKITVNEVKAGERAALQITGSGNLHARTLVSHYRNPSFFSPIHRVLATFHAIPFYRSQLKSGMKCHISSYCETVVATCSFIQDEGEGEFEKLSEPKNGCNVVLSFDRPLFVPNESFYIASKLEQQGKGCRFAFRGNFIRIIKDPNKEISQFTRKQKEGKIERIEEERRSAIVTGLFKKESNIEVFQNMKVVLEPLGMIGKIESKFGKSGKTRIVFEKEIDDEKIGDKNNLRIKLYMKNLRFFSKEEGLGDDGLPKDYKVKKWTAGSRRIDTFVNRATGKGSTATEKLILTGKVMVNESIVKKKAYNVCIDDVVDIWEQPVEDNTSLAEVHRIEITNYEVNDKGYTFHAKSWRKFIVPNWKDSQN
ncbi:hypothetical protein WR25_16119 [Diploscapter pachys]|uniref:Tr-type G domain-containing protein n=1 Tax=Diploscapter pachys TaxID=2018661 RepID=A0A2A2LBD7_9BILA|nr:hypothetical protein WR25_16119 [Diploscapter pachys]